MIECNEQDDDVLRCVICDCVVQESDSGLCDKHKYGEQKDCPTCRHTRGGDCGAPRYLEMPDEARRAFWDEPVPCRLWEPK